MCQERNAEGQMSVMITDYEKRRRRCTQVEEKVLEQEAAGRRRSPRICRLIGSIMSGVIWLHFTKQLENVCASLRVETAATPGQRFAQSI